jgi:transcriptional regulator with XRE-family HTH domain
MTRLRLRRLALGWPQWQLARASGVSVNKISFAERGLVGLLTPADRRRLAAALDADEDVLFPNVEGGAWERAASRVPALSDETGAAAAGLPDALRRWADHERGAPARAGGRERTST